MSKTARSSKPTDVARRTESNLLSRLQDDLDRMESLFDSMWAGRGFKRPDWPSLRSVGFKTPAVDVFEDGDDVVVKAEIPGAKKEEIEVNVTDSVLTISGRKERKEEVKDENYYRCERSYGSFSRSVELPGEVQAGKAKATFTDGVLEIRLPKTEESKRKAVKLKIQ